MVEMLASLSPPRRRLVLTLLALLAAAAIGAGAAAALQQQDVDLAPVAQDQPGPVLLVPGYGGSTSALMVVAGELEAAGRTATVLQLPGDGTGDLREAAAVLDDAADDALAAGAPSVDVVGYSAGGVTARYWASELGGADVARRVITLGSPHHGTRLAGLGVAVAPGSCPLGCRQLAPGSDLLAELNSGDETPDGPLWTTVWTDQDEVVTPPDSARLDGATAVVVQQVCPGTPLDHGGLPRSPLVLAVVLESLGVAAPPSSYGPDDCARLSS
jgi:triacylglycerol esterase/lipase EstA (alpha/beta hydrolase family)